MLCPKCEKDIDIGEQVKFADKAYYEDVFPPIVLMITCEDCEEVTAMVDIIGTDGFEMVDVKSPAMGGKIVKVPRLKKKK